MRNLMALGYRIIWCLSLVSCYSITEQTPVFSEQQPTQKISYNKLLKSPDCSLPCWNGIEANQTELQTAKEILIDKYGAENIISSDEKSLEWDGNGIDGVKGGYFSFYESVVYDGFVVFEKDSGPFVEDLLLILGEPNWVFVSSQPHDICRGFDIIFPMLGLHAYTETNEGQKNIQPHTRLMILRFSQPTLSEKIQVFDGYLVKWEGYKNYCE